MRIELQRYLDKFAGMIICAFLSLHNWVKKPHPISNGPRKILVILLSEMGSLVLSQPMVHQLKRKYPGANIYFLVFAKNKEVVELAGLVPERRVITIDNSNFISFSRSLIASLKMIRQNRMDAVVDCELFSRISSIISYLSGAPIRVGFHPFKQEGLFRGNLVNHPVPYNPYQHIAHQFLTLADAVDSSTRPAGKRRVPQELPGLKPVRFNDWEILKFEKNFRARFPGIQDRKLVLMYPGGGILPIRAWPLDNFAEVGRSLLDKGFSIGIIGLKSDQRLAERLKMECGHERCINLAGYTQTIKDLLLLLQAASLLITNDGGSGHFASLIPLPTITLFGPETPVLYGPLNPFAFSMYANFSCSPCLTAYNHRESSCHLGNQCLTAITPQEVLSKAMDLLNESSRFQALRVGA